MTLVPGTAVWFARHESRLAWRDWLSMITAGRRERLRRVVIAILVFAIFMHFVAYWMVGRYADAPVDTSMLVTITASVLLSWLLMISQAMESMTRAFYARSDLDLILASPVAARRTLRRYQGTQTAPEPIPIETGQPRSTTPAGVIKRRPPPAARKADSHLREYSLYEHRATCILRHAVKASTCQGPCCLPACAPLAS